MPLESISNEGGQLLKNQSQLPGRVYDAFRVVFRVVLACTMRWKIDGREHEPEEGGVLVAVCHLNHLDPVLVSTVLRRRIGWMSRVEFYRGRWMRRFLSANGAFPVNRQGYARPALREALARLAAGEVVGIFPEGEIMSGAASVLHGGRLRHGVCWLAAKSQKPVLPVVVLGSEQLVRISPWLPARRGRLWLTAGPLMSAPPEASTRQGRAAFAAELESEFRRLRDAAVERYRIPATSNSCAVLPGRPDGHAFPAHDPLSPPLTDSSPVGS